ncbi:hypothetical protein DMENIID0001_098810 [Sergentomyia squamirostris]
MENYTSIMENEYQGVDFVAATGLEQALETTTPNNAPNDVVSLQPPPEMKQPGGEEFEQAAATMVENMHQEAFPEELPPALESQENCQPPTIEPVNDNIPVEEPPIPSKPDNVEVFAEVDLPEVNSTAEEGVTTSADASQVNETDPTDDPIEANPEEAAKVTEETPVQPVRKKEEEVDPQQCRVCTTKENLVDIFSPFEDSVISEKIQIICRTVKILERDFLPHFICSGCVDKLKIALEFKETCENTDREMRKKLKRSKKTIRRNTEFVLIDADAFSESHSEEEKKRTDDEEFKLSDVVESSASSDTDSTFHSGEKVKKYKGKRGRPPGSTSQRGRRRSRNDVVFIAAPMSDEGETSESKKKYKGKSLQCQTCNEVFASPASLAKHSCSLNECPLEDVGRNNQSSEDEEEDKPLAKRRKTKDSGHQCKFCRLTFRTMSELKNHKAQHKGEKPYLCRICNKTFKLAQSLNGHLQRHENEDSQVTCQHCWKYFPNKKELRKHEATAHATAFTCERCKRNFTSQTRLNNHRQLTCPGVVQAPKKRQEVEASVVGRDLFKCVAPMTTTYWSDSFSE